MMSLIKKSLLILFCAGLTNLSLAATHYKKPQFATITAIDVKNKTIVLYDELYYISPRIKVNYSGKNFSSIRDLYSGMEVNYRTIKNRTTRRVEVREIWVIPD